MFAVSFPVARLFPQDTVNHLTWYEATNFKRPFPGETHVRAPSEFKDRLGRPVNDDDDD